MHTLNDSLHHDSTRLVEVEDPSSSNGSYNISTLLRIVLHKMLCIPVLVAGVVQLIPRSVTMVSTIMLTCLSKLREITKRWRWGNNYNMSRSRPLVNTTLVNLLPLLLMLCHGIINVSVTDSTKFLG